MPELFDLGSRRFLCAVGELADGSRALRGLALTHEPWHRGGMANEVPAVLGPRPARYDRRRALLHLALIAQAGAAVVLIRPAVVSARSSESPQQSTPSTTAMNSVPSALVLDDGRTVELLGLGNATTTALLTRVANEIGGAVDAVVSNNFAN
jgi:ferric-dicitrate binding protein FerR (iron transport regulator)